MKRLWLLLTCTALCQGVLLADDKVNERLAESARVFGEIMSAPDKSVPKDILAKADYVAIIPGMKREASSLEAVSARTGSILT